MLSRAFIVLPHAPATVAASTLEPAMEPLLPSPDDRRRRADEPPPLAAPWRSEGFFEDLPEEAEFEPA